MAVYNGERFIAEQIESILAQDHCNWRLCIRDDGSNDRTAEICAAYAREQSSRIRILTDSAGNLGLVENFGRIVAATTAPYVMFADQDDLWFPEKVRRQLEVMRRLEAQHGESMPLAVFGDAEVIDSTGRLIAPSLLRYINRQRRPGEQSIRRLCVEGNCYGCTMMVNRALVERMGAIPPGAISHDWWCGLVAALFGKLVLMEGVLLRHRRHTSNQSATKQNSVVRYARERPSLARHRRWLHTVFAQCELVVETYGGDLPKHSIKMMRDISHARQGSWLKRRLCVCRHGVRMTGLARNVGFFLAV